MVRGKHPLPSFPILPFHQLADYRGFEEGTTLTFNPYTNVVFGAYSTKWLESIANVLRYCE